MYEEPISPESMNFSDRYAFFLHVAIAKKLDSDTERTIKIAKNNIARWLAKGVWHEVGPFRQWTELLDISSIDELRSRMLELTDRGQDFRSKTPFPGVLSEAERKRIYHECGKLGLD